MNDPDDRVTGRQMVLGGLFALVFAVAVAGLILLLTALAGDSTTTPPTTARTVPTTTVAPAATTTTVPYANLRASLNDYCGAKGLGHAVITMHNGAPDGGCSGA